ncbi:MAG: exosortase N [Agriterribacter sp.]
MTTIVLTGMRRLSVHWMAILLLAIYGIIFCWMLGDYINVRSFDFQLGVLSILVVFSSTRSNARGGLRFAIAAVVAAVITCLLPAKTMLYTTLLLCVFFVAETYAGKMHLLSLLAIVFISPVCRYVTSIFSFPIRLQLTKWASGMLSFTGNTAMAEGNVIQYNGNEFSVDPACMGLYMLITSMLSGIMVMALQQKKYRRTLPVTGIAFLLCSIVICNVLCNLFRIFTLVYYNIPPGEPMHDVVGIACFLLYVVSPALALVTWMIKRYGKPVTQTDRGKAPGYHAWLHMIVLAFCVVALLMVMKQQRSAEAGRSVETRAGYTVSTLPNNVIKMENDHALIYIKSIAGFYSSDHHPMICWGGSGYAFIKVQTGYIGNRNVYTGMLGKGNDRLYTAWWYENGTYFTIKQWDWRWDMLRGGNAYALVNITAASADELEKQVLHFIETGSRKRMLP